jgi:type IV secretion system protein VirB9
MKALRPLACAAAFAAFAASIPALALETPLGAARDKRIRMVDYAANDVVRIVGRYRASTQIEFAPDEEIAHVAIGDSASWEVAPVGNILFLKPREKSPPTNLQVVAVRPAGGRRVYLFELTAIGGTVTRRNAYFAVRFRYPSDEAERRQRQAEARRAAASRAAVDEALFQDRAASPRNWRYSAQGSRSLEPDAIYDDGKSTGMRFSGNREIPAVYRVNGDGGETLVPWDARDGGELIVVHAIAREFRLRRGGDVLCVFNEAYAPEGVNPGAGTASPSVERVIRPEPRGSAR